jgi:hypothetical protein
VPQKELMQRQIGERPCWEDMTAWVKEGLGTTGGLGLLTNFQVLKTYSGIFVGNGLYAWKTGCQ